MTRHHFCLVRVCSLLLAIGALSLGCVRGSVSVEQTKALMRDGAKLVDVRTPQEFAGGAIPGAVNIPYGSNLAQQTESWPRDLPVVVYCHAGTRSAAAASLLREKGFTKVYDFGAISRWR